MRFLNVLLVLLLLHHESALPPLKFFVFFELNVFESTFNNCTKTSLAETASEEICIASGACCIINACDFMLLGGGCVSHGQESVRQLDHTALLRRLSFKIVRVITRLALLEFAEGFGHSVCDLDALRSLAKLHGFVLKHCPYVCLIVLVVVPG